MTYMNIEETDWCFILFSKYLKLLIYLIIMSTIFIIYHAYLNNLMTIIFRIEMTL